MARGSHVGYKLNLLRCGDFWLFTAGCKDVTTGLLSTFIGFFVVLGYRLQNMDCAGRVRCAQSTEYPSDVQTTDTAYYWFCRTQNTVC